MTITYDAGGNLSLKTKQATVSFGSDVTIGEYRIPGAGEYDVQGVQCECAFVGTTRVTFLHAEDLTVTYLSAPVDSLKDLPDAADTHILAAYLPSDSTAATLKPVIKALEPGYLFLIGPGAQETLLSELNLNTVPAPLRVTLASLPSEGTTLVQS